MMVESEDPCLSCTALNYQSSTIPRGKECLEGAQRAMELGERIQGRLKASIFF